MVTMLITADRRQQLGFREDTNSKNKGNDVSQKCEKKIKIKLHVYWNLLRIYYISRNLHMYLL